MKKSILAFILLCSCVLVITSCGNKEIKDLNGVVVDFKVERDTLTLAKILVNQDTIIFKMADARFINGMFVAGDSVKISCIEGHKDTLRALIVSVLPQTPHFIDIDAAKNDTLITAPDIAR